MPSPSISAAAVLTQSQRAVRGLRPHIGARLAFDGVRGELVCTAPFPSMPIGFWNDPDGICQKNECNQDYRANCTQD